MGSLPCDIDYLGRYAVVAALDGPDRSRGAPIYLLEDDRLVSTIFPKDDLGLVNFKHIHNAVLREAGGKLYIIAQAWNPGDFAVLEQVVDQGARLIPAELAVPAADQQRARTTW